MTVCFTAVDPSMLTRGLKRASRLPLFQFLHQSTTSIFIYLFVQATSIWVTAGPLSVFFSMDSRRSFLRMAMALTLWAGPIVAQATNFDPIENMCVRYDHQCRIMVFRSIPCKIANRAASHLEEQSTLY